MTLLLLLISLGSITQTEDNHEKHVLTYSGKALTIKTGNFFCIENHNEVTVDKKHVLTEIHYTDEKGGNVGSKTLDFSKSSIAPFYRLEDVRGKYREGAEVVHDKVTVFYHYIDEEKTPTTKTFTVPEPIVIDGGFNNFVKMNWDLLMQGNMLTFNFVSPYMKDYFTLRISKKEDLMYGHRKATMFCLELDNMFLRWLLSSPVKVTYDTQTKRMLRYEGIGNLQNENARNEIVKLDFPELGP